MTLADLFSIRPAHLLDIDGRDARLVLAARCWCVSRAERQNPMPRIAGYLQSHIAATRLALLMNAVQQTWPDPFAVHRPCCPAASVDEMLLVAMVRLAVVGARPAFDTLLSDMLGCEARDLLFSRAASLYRDGC